MFLMKWRRQQPQATGCLEHTRRMCKPSVGAYLSYLLCLIVCSKVDSCAQKAIRTDWPHNGNSLALSCEHMDLTYACHAPLVSRDICFSLAVSFFQLSTQWIGLQTSDPSRTAACWEIGFPLNRHLDQTSESWPYCFSKIN